MIGTLIGMESEKNKAGKNNLKRTWVIKSSGERTMMYIKTVERGNSKSNSPKDL